MRLWYRGEGWSSDADPRSISDFPVVTMTDLIPAQGP